MRLCHHSAHTVNRCPFHSVFSVISFPWGGVRFGVTSLFKMAPKHGAEVLSNVPTDKKAVMCLTERHFLEKLHSSMCCGAVSREFHVNESAICIK